MASTATGAMLASMKATMKQGSKSDLFGLGSTSSTRTPKSPRSTSKSKKLTDKGKAKLAGHRAEQRASSELARLEQAYAEDHPELIDEHGEMEMPGVDDLFADGLTHDERVATWTAEELKALENEEMVRKLAKLQRKHNTMQNALLKGNNKAAGYDRDEIDLKVVQKELRKTRERERNAIIVLEEALPLIRNATNAAALGQRQLLAYLDQEAIISEFNNTDMRYLLASLDAELERRPSPINFRVEILWRFGCTIHEYKRGDREQNLRLAHHVYTILLDRCDPERHPFQYAGLHNTMELCEIELERVTGTKVLQRANRDFEYAPLDDPSTGFNFERKDKKPLGER